METLIPFKLFTRPMDRAELLHVLSYDIELHWKNSPGKFKLVKLIEKLISPADFTHSSQPVGHPTCPGPLKILLSKMQAVYTSHVPPQPWKPSAILNLEMSLWAKRRQFSTKFRDVQIFHNSHGNLERVQTFCSAYGST